MSNKKYLQYGCGYSSPAPRSWKNYDASPTLRYERVPLIGRLYTKNIVRFPENVEYGDITKGLPPQKDGYKGVYCSHVLEHLSLDDFRKALFNTYRLLAKDGIFRLVLPDLEYSINKYVNDSSKDAALIFMKETILGQEKRNLGVKDLFISLLGNSQHLWMWDYKSIEAELQNIGFIKVRRAQFGDSEDSFFEEVEERGRWENCLGVECRK